MNPKIAVWAGRLKDPNAAVRAEAIRGLEDMGDPDALLILGELYATDPEPHIRALAQWAGKSIYFNLHRQQEVARGASEEERRRAAEILAKAQQKKMQRR